MPRPGRNPYENPRKFLLVDRVEHRSCRSLDDLVLQSEHAGPRYCDRNSRSYSVRRQTIFYARCGLLFKFEECLIEQINADVVEERGELLLLPFPLLLAVCAPAPVTRLSGPASRTCFAGPHSSWSPPLAPTSSAADRSALFASFPATMAESDFSRPCIIGYGSSPSRCGPPTQPTDGQTRDIPSSNAILLRVMWPSTAAGRQCLA